LAFQIRDDLLDYLGHKSILGKQIGVDIKEKKLTLPFITALRHSSRGEAQRAIQFVKKGAKQKDITWLVDYVRENGGIEYSIKKAEEFATQASACLTSFPDSPMKQSLLQFIRFVVERNK
jgi:octaprenyl-diphosphate synthase